MFAEIKPKIYFHIQRLSSVYLFVLLLLFIGVIFGAVLVNSLSVTQKQELAQYLNSFFIYFSNDIQSTQKEILIQSYINNIKYIGMIWMLGISLIGLPIIFILLFFKGVVVGFTVGLLVQQFGLKGFSIALLSVFPQNIIMLPIFIFISAIAIQLCIRIFKRQFMNEIDRIKPLYIHYAVSFVVIIILLFFGSLFETYVSPLLMNAALKMFGIIIM